MQVLLDTNVWRYLVDSGRQDSLYTISRKSNVKVVVCPSVVIETLRLSDLAIRRQIIEIQTRDCWERLMPDAYLQCEDVKTEIRRTHPEWKLSSTNISLYRKLRYDWVRSRGGFWSEVRNKTDSIAAQYRVRDTSMLDQTREQARQMRSTVMNSEKGKLVSKPLKELTGSWTMPNGDNVEVDFWRVYAEAVWGNLLFQHDSVFRQWMGCDLNLNLLSHYYLDFVNFWAYQVKADSVPREWLRAAIYALQGDRKVTDGNPVDSAIGVHLVDVDFVISADKTFVSIVNRCHEEAPFSTASALLINAGNTGIDQLFQMISEGFEKKHIH